MTESKPSVDPNGAPGADAPGDLGEDLERIRALPKEVGVLLIVAGIGGLVLPGPIGTPFMVLGCLVLWPRAFTPVEACLKKRFPRLHKQSLVQIHRYLDDMERRYPVQG